MAAVKLSDLQGRTLKGCYRLDELLDVGGQGAVFRATQIALGRTVAVKISLPADLPAAQLRMLTARFDQESKVLGRLDAHPNIVTLYEAGQTSVSDFGPLLYMVQTYIAGTTLKAYLHRQKHVHGRDTLAPRRAVALLVPVLRALGAAHAADIVHRDIKPGNLMLSAQGGHEVVTVIDFGIAKDLTSTAPLTRGAVLGTGPYMAPEQCTGGPIGPATDLYAVGVVLFRMLAGWNPFSAADFMGYLPQHEHARPFVPTTVPRPFADVLRKALEKAPDDRYTRAEDMIRALEVALDAVGEAADIAPPRGEPWQRPTHVGPARRVTAPRVTAPSVTAPRVTGQSEPAKRRRTRPDDDEARGPEVGASSGQIAVDPDGARGDSSPAAARSDGAEGDEGSAAPRRPTGPDATPDAQPTDTLPPPDTQPPDNARRGQRWRSALLLGTVLVAALSGATALWLGATPTETEAAVERIEIGGELPATVSGDDPAPYEPTARDSTVYAAAPALDAPAEPGEPVPTSARPARSARAASADRPARPPPARRARGGAPAQMSDPGDRSTPAPQRRPRHRPPSHPAARRPQSARHGASPRTSTRRCAAAAATTRGHTSKRCGGPDPRPNAPADSKRSVRSCSPATASTEVRDDSTADVGRTSPVGPCEPRAAGRHRAHGLPRSLRRADTAPRSARRGREPRRRGARRRRGRRRGSRRRG